MTYRGATRNFGGQGFYILKGQGSALEGVQGAESPKDYNIWPLLRI